MRWQLTAGMERLKSPALSNFREYVKWSNLSRPYCKILKLFYFSYSYGILLIQLTIATLYT